jgi:tRNA (guanine37-N1)-methyltransferase
MKVNVITIFPDVMETILSMGMLGVASRKSLAEYSIVNPRDFTTDTHRTMDDEPYGGGGGMSMMVPPLVEAVESLALPDKSPVILLTPSGERFSQKLAHRYAAESQLTFICGRYKGVDERIRELVVTDEISIGDFVLSGGELAAAVCIEAIIRLQDNVLGNQETWESDSFEKKRAYQLDCAYYTRPVEYRGLRVPEVLTSGNHKAIDQWREASSLERTQKRRPDLLTEE